MWRIVLFCLCAAPVQSETVLATRLVRPGTVVTAVDVALHPADTPGAHSAIDQVLGQEARVVLYAGRPIRQGDLRAPALIERNALVPLIFRQGALEISAEGRALDRGAAGDVIGVLNTASRARVMGRVLPDGRVVVE